MSTLWSRRMSIRCNWVSRSVIRRETRVINLTSASRMAHPRGTKNDVLSEQEKSLKWLQKISLSKFFHYMHVPNPLHVCTLKIALDECEFVWTDNPLVFLAMIKDIVWGFFFKVSVLVCNSQCILWLDTDTSASGVSVDDACDRL